MLDFQSYDGVFCPILTAGLGKLTDCHERCEWFCQKTRMCSLSVIAALGLHDPDIQAEPDEE